MKLNVLALLLALGAAPSLALAQTAPPAPPAAGMRAHSQEFRQFAQQARSMQLAARSQMLSALTAEHRAEIARVIGSLAISTNPDPRAAARDIDAMLSPRERDAILSAQTAERSQMQALHQQMLAQMEQAHPEMAQRMQQMHARMDQMHGQAGGRRHAPTAGSILLRTLVPGHEGHGGHPMGAPHQP